MALDPDRTGDENGPQNPHKGRRTSGVADDTASRSSEEEEEEEEEEEDEEPKLKYASLTKAQGPIYRNDDAASSFLVAGDKMIIGTHNGNIHVLSMPSLQSLRVYHAHSASITAISISPFPPPLPVKKPDAISRIAAELQDSPGRSPSTPKTSSASPKSPRLQPPVPATPSNSIHIATSSIDGNVCVSSLVDPRDVVLRNFGRPVQSVAISPEFKQDRTYLSGGLAGNLVLTIGGRAGTSSKSNTTSGVAAAAGWLGAIGLNSSNGTDAVLHSGEGSISTIKWSLSGKYIMWVNEQGIKTMRSNLHLDGAESDFAWKRMSHLDRPNRTGWEEMASVWKARIEWIDEDGLESNEPDAGLSNGSSKKSEPPTPGTLQLDRKKERVVIGWGSSIWIVDIHNGGPGTGKDVGERKIGRVEVIKILRTDDCTISGISLYTPNLLLVLAYVTPTENAVSPAQGTAKRGPSRRQNALQPEMKIIDIVTEEEVCYADTLSVSRFESLSATDYHLGVLPVIRSTSKAAAHRGALEVIGGSIWDASLYPVRLFNSGASVLSNGSHAEKNAGSKAPSGAGSDVMTITGPGTGPHPALLTRGMKIFIQSPYDCVLATKPTLADHLAWLDLHEKYEEAWNLLNTHPEAASGLSDDTSSLPSTPSKAPGSLVDFFADDSSQITTLGSRNFNSQAEKDKRRIGEKWLQQLVKDEDWTKAGQVAAQVLGTSSSWEHWVWVFVQAQRFAEITPYIPTVRLQPPISSTVYEMILGHFISKDRLQLRELLDRWPSELFDVGSIVTAIEGKLKVGEFREDTVEDGETGRDWRILMDCLAKLYLADGRARDALKCYIKIQDADAAMYLITEHHLIDALSDDIPGLILLRVSKDQQKNASLAELEEASIEPIRLLVSEAHHGIVLPETVVSQLQSRDGMLPYLFFYLRALWNGDTLATTSAPQISSTVAHLATEGKSLVNDFADTAISLFAEYDRPLLLDFLKSSQSYDLSSASTICKTRNYIPELVYLYAKEGRTKEALFVIIDKLGDVSQAIAFAKEQDDADLWNDLLDYSMNKPTFIRALLEQVGTSIDPVTLVRRIPEGLQIDGLRDGLSRMIREYELQYSISEGVARVLRGEVAMGMSVLRTGQKRGVKFEVAPRDRAGASLSTRPKPDTTRPGHCFGCGELFSENETNTLISFPCPKTHTFHLPCLLLYTSTTTNDPKSPISEPDIPPLPPRPSHSTSIGPKILHAKELSARVGDGCPVAVH